MFLPARKPQASNRTPDAAASKAPISRPGCDEARERIAAVRLKLQTVALDDDLTSASKGPRSALQLGG